jgi:putative NIF3 family GTP cyclohydrolase 1 type 2
LISKQNQETMTNRREFITKTLMASGVLAVVPSLINAEPQKLTVQDVIDIIMKDLGGIIDSKSVDTIKAGKTDTVVTGIVCTMFATMDIIEQAKKLGANFIIAHEPVFYNHTDDKTWVKKNEVLSRKLSTLDKDWIVVWRFHDYCHQIKPEPMSYGIAKRCGWTAGYKTGSRIHDIPAMKLSVLTDHLKKSLGLRMVRVIGDMDMSCSKIALMPGASGGQSHLIAVEENDPDVLRVGEVHEWETGEYIRDRNLEGKKTALIILGHSVSEEPGMEVVTEWLTPKMPGIKVTHIASGDPFTWR